MKKAWGLSSLAFLFLVLFSACRAPENETADSLPDPAELIAERRMEAIRNHQTLVVGIAPSPLAAMERQLVSALLKDTGYRFRIINAEPETLFAFLRAARADIICGLFTKQELMQAYLAPAAPFLHLSFHILHHKEFKEPETENTGEELLYPDSAPEIFFLPELQTKLRKRPVARELIFHEMEQAPEKRAVFLCSLFLPKPESSDLLVKNVDFKTVPIQLCFGLRRQDFELSTLLTERLAKLSADGTLDNLTHPFLFQAKTENEPETIDEKK